MRDGASQDWSLGGGAGVALGLVRGEVIVSTPMAAVFLTYHDLPLKRPFILNYDTCLNK